MLYYRVKPEYDNKPVPMRMSKGNRVINNGTFLIGGEMYTPREFEKLQKLGIPSTYFDKVDCPKNHVWISFGARFAPDFWCLPITD